MVVVVVLEEVLVVVVVLDLVEVLELELVVGFDINFLRKYIRL